MPSGRPPKNQTEEQRFYSYIKINEYTDCWEWQGYLNQSGYGKFTLNGKSGRCHRKAYQMFVGKIPDGLQIDHLCNNRRCVNYKHLQPVTAKTNTRRASSGMSVIDAGHCPYGHELYGDNLSSSAWNKLGRRVCKICKNANGRRSYHKKRK